MTRIDLDSAQPVVARSRQTRTIGAVFALVAALLTTGIVAPATADVVGTGPGSISGTVMSGGVPLANIYVSVYSTTAPLWLSASTDSVGHFELTGVELGTYGMSVYADGYQQPSNPSISLTADAPAFVVEIVLEPWAVGTGVVTGTVTVDGSPQSGVSVNFFSGGQSFNAWTDDSGQFVLSGLVNGDWGLSAYGGSAYQSSYQTVTISDTAQTVTANFVLEPWPAGTAAISGVITDSATGEPVPDAYVGLNGTDVAHNSSTNSDSSGAFAFSLLPEGSYSIYISGAGYVGHQEQINVYSDQTLTLDRTLFAANSTISGHVEDAEGQPVQGLWVSAQLDAYYYTGGGGQTDSNGDYSISGLGAGQYTVTIGGMGTSWVKQDVPVTAIADDSVVVDFTLAPRVTGSIVGYVSGADSFGIESICTDVYDAASGEPVAGSRGTPTDGTFIVSDLDVGEYKVLYWDCDYSRSPGYSTVFWGGSAVLSTAATVTVSAGVDTYLNDFSLSLGGTIDGHISVETADGVTELPTGRGMDASVFQVIDGVLEELPDPSPFVGAGGLGDYTVSGLPAGEYVVGFVDSTYFGARSYATEYWQDALDAADATPIVITGSELVSGIDAVVGIPEPTTEPVAVATEDLPAADEDAIVATDSAAQGTTVDVTVGADYAGEWVSVWGHSTPTLFGDWVQVTTAGTISVTVPLALAAGSHTLVAQTADDEVIGWTPISVTATDPFPGKGHHYAYGHDKKKDK